MPMEQTLVLLKPDAVQRGLIGEIISRFERVGLKIIAMKMQYANKELALKHYEKDEEWFKEVGERVNKVNNTSDDPVSLGKEVQRQLAAFISYSPLIALVLEGNHAVDKVRKLVGEQSPENSPPGTIRGDMSFDSYSLANVSGRPIMNLIHASGNTKEAAQEISLWFTKEEIHAWERVMDDFLYLRDI